MRRLMLRSQSQSGRRRPRLAPHLCAAVAAALLLLLSLSLLHHRLSSSPLRPLHPTLPASNSSSSSSSTLPQLDDPWSSLDDIDDSSSSSSSSSPDTPAASSLFWDHALAVTRQAFNTPDPHHPRSPYTVLPSYTYENIKIAFGSDDQPINEAVRLKLDSINTIEDVLMLNKGAMRDGWARWLEGKAGFLRGDRMLRSNLEGLNPKNHPLLHDPDVGGAVGLTRGDRQMQKALLKEMESTPFPDVKRVEARRKALQVNADPRHLERFSEFMEGFLGEEGGCGIKVFMVWNSPAWMFGVRHQRGMESVLYHHKDACVVVFSETMEPDFFDDFVKDGYKVAVVMPNLDQLFEGTPVHEFASAWFEWRQTKHYPVHYSELVRLAALYKYGGVYLDSDIIVLKTLDLLENSVAVEDQVTGNIILNGAVMSFKRHSPFLMECLVEFYTTYDDTRLRWNGAELLTRVINRLHVKGEKSEGQLDMKIGPSVQFFPLSSMDIRRYFMAAADENERVEQDVLLKRILDESMTFHFWNGLTSALTPEPNSLVDRLINQYCLRCLDVL